MAALNDGKIDAGLIPPTHLLAALRTSPVWEATVYRHWTPEFCLGWLRNTPADAGEDRNDPQPVSVDSADPAGSAEAQLPASSLAP